MDRETASCSVQKCLSCIPSPSVTTAALVCVTMLISGDVVSADQASEDQSDSQHSEYTFPIVACASAVAFLLLAVYVLASCTDCYKSEVSTDFHPATGQTEVKWGGAGGYSAATSSDVNDTILGAGFTDEVVLPGQGSQALPYTMIPSQVPEAQGFRGYGSAPAAEGLRGYSAGEGEPNLGGHGGGMGQGGGRHLPGAHVSPVEPEDPPPPYM